MAVLAVFLCTACNLENKEALDYIPVKVGEKWGYVDREGKYLINPQFENAGPFYDGWAVVQRESGEYAFINTDGKVMNNAWYKGVTHFSEGKAWVVRENSAPTLIDTKGKELAVVKEAQTVYAFSEGLALATVQDEKTGNTLCGYLDGKGKWSLRPQWNNAGWFSEGRAMVARVNEEKNVWENGYIDKNGKLVIPYQFVYAEPFKKDGTAIVSLNGKDGWMHGQINQDGQYLITPQFGDLNSDGNELTCRFAGSDKYGRCDSKGRIVVNPQFKGLGLFLGEKLAPASLGEDKVGYIDRTGRFVINPQFDFGSAFADGMAIVSIDGKFGFINESGKYIVNPQFDGVAAFVINAYHGIPQESFVTTDFFDVTYIAGKLRELIKGGGVDGYTLDMTVGDIMTKAQLDEDMVVRSTSGITSLKNEPSWLPGISLRIGMRGDFFNSVSDGWWGYVKVLDKKRRPSCLVCTIDISDYSKKDKLPMLFDAVKKAFKARGTGKKQTTTMQNGLKLEFTVNESINIVIRKQS